MNEAQIVQEFSNKENIYYGHGIGAERQDVIESIFKHGLRCSHEQLEFTTIPFGEGSDELFKENEETMNNWKHKGSKQIIIASVPRDYHLLNLGNLYKKRQAAFYNYFSQEEATKLGLSQGYYLKPEFVRGVYDANSKSFISNAKYYENLSLEAQKELFDEIKKQYIDLLKGSQWTLEEYAQIIRRTMGIDIPLTAEEIAQADKEVFDAQALETELGSIVESSREGEFNQTTWSIREDSQEDKDMEINDEGWSLDDWE